MLCVGIVDYADDRSFYRGYCEHIEMSGMWTKTYKTVILTKANYNKDVQ